MVHDAKHSDDSPVCAWQRLDTCCVERMDYLRLCGRAVDLGVYSPRIPHLLRCLIHWSCCTTTEFLSVNFAKLASIHRSFRSTYGMCIHVTRLSPGGAADKYFCCIGLALKGRIIMFRLDQRGPVLNAQREKTVS